MKLGYARVSTTGQNLEAQIAALWAAGVEKIYQDKASGKDRNHPALKEMLDFARQGDEIVVSLKIGKQAALGRVRMIHATFVLRSPLNSITVESAVGLSLD